VILTHNLGSGAVAYSGQKVTFTCTVNIVVNHDIVITWRSEDYIGRGHDVLQVTSKDPEGTTDHKLTTAVMLINRTQSNGMVTIVTELQLIASAMYFSSQVGCKPNGHETVMIAFRKSDIE
jgi:hypothetical protein